MRVRMPAGTGSGASRPLRTSDLTFKSLQKEPLIAPHAVHPTGDNWLNEAVTGSPNSNNNGFLGLRGFLLPCLAVGLVIVGVVGVSTTLNDVESSRNSAAALSTIPSPPPPPRASS